MTFLVHGTLEQRGVKWCSFLFCCLCTLEPQEAICIRRDSSYLLILYIFLTIQFFFLSLLSLYICFLDLSPTTPLQSESELDSPLSNRTCVSV